MLFDLLQGGFDLRTFIIQMLLSILPFLLALSAHEAAHAWVADRCGDPTARYLGRLTLNPLAHVDPIGFLMLFVVGFGWAKPVPVNPNNYRHFRRDDIKVSLAGITANLLLFVIGCLVMFGMVAFAINKLPAGSLTGSDISLVFLNPGSYGYGLIVSLFGDIFGYVYLMFYILVRINMVLAVLNILPVPPLDGYHVLNDLVLRRPLFAPQRAAMIGQIVLIALIFTGALDKVFSTVTGGAMTGAGTAFEALFRFLHII